MNRVVLIASSVALAGILLGCTGAAADVQKLPHGYRIFQGDHWEYRLLLDSTNQVGGHVTKWAADERFILIERDVCEFYSNPARRNKPDHRLTGVIEYYIQQTDPADGTDARDWKAIRDRLHGPFTAAEFAAARERLGVPAGLTLTAP